MPTVFSHAVVGLTAGRSIFISKQPIKFWILSIILPILPDADILSFVLGIPYEHFLGHRGFFHSIFFAGCISFSVVFLFFRNYKILSLVSFKYFIYFFLITASHGLLDSFTSGGLGSALLSPFDNTRYFFPLTPILVSPIGIKSFFSAWGFRVIQSEVIWVWIPSTVILFLSIVLRLVLKKIKIVNNEKKQI